MSDLHQAIHRDARVLAAACEPTWQLADHAPELFERLAAREPAIAALSDELRSHVPVQRSWAFGDIGAFTRPDRHVRAWYLDLPRVDRGRGAGGAVAIKGGEALCDNFAAIVERLADMWNIYAWQLSTTSRQLLHDPGMLSALERFPVIEGKPPGVHPHWDAEDEAGSALELQRAYVARHGELARAPVPLVVGRWPAAVADRIYAILEPAVSPKARRVVRAELDAGLGVYVYYYPCVPLRVAHIQAPDATSAPALDQRITALRALCDPELTIERWIELVTRVLALGYVTTDPANLNRGYCTQPQNMVLDGGFVDVNSLRAIASFRTEGEFRFALHRTIQSLAQSITWFVSGSLAGTTEHGDNVPDLFARIWNDVRDRLATASLHPWLAAALARRALFDELVDSVRQLVGMSAYHPGEREQTRHRTP